MIIRFKTFGYSVIAIACLSVFWNPGDDREGIRGTIGSFLFIASIFTYEPVGAVIQTFSKEKPVFLKEYSNKTYRLLPYILSK
mmetsp:Transcript_23989/g.26653  ORF Transcript_23989/g.26653 Transcript_23989/m.26653 type:complete len:83 (+) Transcript_23989:558-806(+)